jgi:hypothetical protein
MPQPMSTPTAAGDTASRIAITEPTVAPLPHVRHDADAVDPFQRGDVAQLLERGLLDLVLVGPHQRLRLGAAQLDGKHDRSFRWSSISTVGTHGPWRTRLSDRPEWGADHPAVCSNRAR